MPGKIPNHGKYTNYSFGRSKLLKEAPLQAEIDPKTPPINAVSRTNKVGLSCLIIILDIRWAKICSFSMLIIQAIIPHKRKTPRNPASIDKNSFCPEANATKKDAITKLHQGKNRPKANVSNEVSIRFTNNFMVYCLFLE